MLYEWLSPVPVQQFIPLHLGRAPYARPGAATRVKDYYFRHNTVLRGEPAETADFSRVRQETSPLLPRASSAATGYTYLPAGGIAYARSRTRSRFRSA
jgi:hypothetical protein